MPRFAVVFVLAFGCAGAVPAQAATVSLDSAGALVVAALPGEWNAIDLSEQAVLGGTDVVVTDSGAPLRAGAGCSQDVLFGVVRCPASRASW